MKLIILFLLLELSFSYNTTAAIYYARRYCKTNYYYYNVYPDGYGNSANFVSQCLRAGGQDLDGCAGIDNKGSIPFVSNLRACLTKKGWKSQKGMPKKFKAGYPFFIENMHARICTNIEGNTIRYCSHSNNICDGRVSANSSFYYYYL